jgi:secreted PhoX family phosphatase
VAVFGSKVYVADTGCQCVRVIDEATDQETVAAGNGKQGYSGDGGPAIDATFDGYSWFTTPFAITVDGAGDLFIADDENNRVREVPAASGVQFGITMTAGDVYTVAGNGKFGYTGDGAAATSAELVPDGVAVDGAGDLLITDADGSNNVVREVAADAGTHFGVAMTAGDIYTVAGSSAGTSGYTGDGGPATSAQLNNPQGPVLDPSGDLIISDNSNNVVREVAAADGTHFGVAMTAGDIYTIAGSNTGTRGNSGDGGPATSAELSGPQGLAMDPAGDLLITDTGNSVVREVAAANGNHFGVVMTANDIYTVAGNATAGGDSGDNGPALQATISYPVGVALDGSGNLLIADYEGNSVRDVAAVNGTSFGIAMTTGDIYLVAGGSSALNPFLGDGGVPGASTLYGPSAVAFDRAGDLFIADPGHYRIREVPATSGTHYGVAMTAGNIYTVAGNGAYGSSGDGGPARHPAVTSQPRRRDQPASSPGTSSHPVAAARSAWAPDGGAATKSWDRPMIRLWRRPARNTVLP